MDDEVGTGQGGLQQQQHLYNISYITMVTILESFLYSVSSIVNMTILLVGSIFARLMRHTEHRAYYVLIGQRTSPT